MNDYDFNILLNGFFARVASVERLADEAERESRVDVTSKITDFTELASLLDDYWKRYVFISELDDSITRQLVELLTLEKKTSEEVMDAVREIVSLSRRTGIAATTVLGAIRRLMNRNSELIEEQKSEILRLKEYEEAFYDLKPPTGGTGDEEE